jgi:hypothetical protein
MLDFRQQFTTVPLVPMISKSTDMPLKPSYPMLAA